MGNNHSTTTDDASSAPAGQQQQRNWNDNTRKISTTTTNNRLQQHQQRTEAVPRSELVLVASPSRRSGDGAHRNPLVRPSEEEEEEEETEAEDVHEKEQINEPAVVETLESPAARTRAHTPHEEGPQPPHLHSQAEDRGALHVDTRVDGHTGGGGGIPEPPTSYGSPLSVCSSSGCVGSAGGNGSNGGSSSSRRRIGGIGVALPPEDIAFQRDHKIPTPDDEVALCKDVSLSEATTTSSEDDDEDNSDNIRKIRKGRRIVQAQLHADLQEQQQLQQLGIRRKNQPQENVGSAPVKLLSQQQQQQNAGGIEDQSPALQQQNRKKKGYGDLGETAPKAEEKEEARPMRGINSGSNKSSVLAPHEKLFLAEHKVPTPLDDDILFAAPPLSMESDDTPILLANQDIKGPTSPRANEEKNRMTPTVTSTTRGSNDLPVSLHLKAVSAVPAADETKLDQTKGTATARMPGTATTNSGGDRILEAVHQGVSTEEKIEVQPPPPLTESGAARAAGSPHFLSAFTPRCSEEDTETRENTATSSEGTALYVKVVLPIAGAPPGVATASAAAGSGSGTANVTPLVASTKESYDGESKTEEDEDPKEVKKPALGVGSIDGPLYDENADADRGSMHERAQKITNENRAAEEEAYRKANRVPTPTDIDVEEDMSSADEDDTSSSSNEDEEKEKRARRRAPKTKSTPKDLQLQLQRQQQQQQQQQYHAKKIEPKKFDFDLESDHSKTASSGGNTPAIVPISSFALPSSAPATATNTTSYNNKKNNKNNTDKSPSRGTTTATEPSNTDSSNGSDVLVVVGGASAAEGGEGANQGLIPSLFEIMTDIDDAVHLATTKDDEEEREKGTTGASKGGKCTTVVRMQQNSSGVLSFPDPQQVISGRSTGKKEEQQEKQQSKGYTENATSGMKREGGLQVVENKTTHLQLPFPKKVVPEDEETSLSSDPSTSVPWSQHREESENKKKEKQKKEEKNTQLPRFAAQGKHVIVSVQRFDTNGERIVDPKQPGSSSPRDGGGNCNSKESHCVSTMTTTTTGCMHHPHAPGQQQPPVDQSGSGHHQHSSHTAAVAAPGTGTAMITAPRGLFSLTSLDGSKSASV